MKRSVGLLALMIAACCITKSEAASTGSNVPSGSLTVNQELLTSAKSGALAKVGPILGALAQPPQPGTLQSQTVIPGKSALSQNPALRIVDGRVVIDAVAAGNVQALAADLKALGMQHVVTVGSIVSGQFPVSALGALASLQSLKFARPAMMKTNAGLTTSQGDHAMRADAARTTFGVDGTGVKVGVLSDSYDCLGGAAGDVANGDLPPGVMVLLDSCPDSTDEGRAMMQIVHDVAPGASEAFHTANGGQATFASGILALAAAGAKVIVDDVIYFAEPMFQDGIIAQAVDTVKGMGVAYFSSAGNDDRQSYESPFTPSGVGLIFGEAHDFGGGDLFQKITVPVGSAVLIVIQWDSPFFSVCGTTGCPGGSPNDLDIFVSDDPPTTLLAGSATDNLGGDPVEIMFFFNDGTFDFNEDSIPDTTFNIFIERFAGPPPAHMKYVRFDFGPGIVTNEFDTMSSTIYGHANAAGATAVGAAFYGSTPPFGVSPAILEPYSSAGPTSIFFTPTGAPTFELRLKPEIVAPDGGNTTFFGFDVEPDGFPNFFGTSAAAPHAAAVAALMLQGGVPMPTPDTIKSILQSTAADMLTPGFDFDTGSGLVQADLAVAAVAPVRGDFNGDRCVDRADSTTILTAIRSGSHDLKYDLNGDGKVNLADARTLVGLYTNPGGAPCPLPT